MAITANTFNIVELPTNGILFYRSLQSENVTSAETLVAAITGKAHYITEIQLCVDAAMDVSFGSGETDSDITTVHIGPVPLDKANGIFAWKAPEGKGLLCTVSTAFVIDSTGAGTVWIEVRGMTCTPNI